MFLQCLVILTLFCAHGVALPIPFDSITSDPQVPPCSEKRKLFNIIWNCISTMILCAWVSVHPNVPPSGYWRDLVRQLETMVWTIIAPELILAWAVRQWFAARKIRDTVNGIPEGLTTGIRGWMGKGNMPSSTRKWTMAHGHLLGMGGIMLVDPAFEDDDSENPHGQLLTFERYTELTASAQGNPPFKLPKITVSDVKDRSKSNFLSKLVTIVQTTWFIMQCIARHQQRLAITELELVTLALASLNAITYAFWWHKPLGMQEPVRIHYKPEATTEGPQVDSPSPDGSVASEISASEVISKVGEILKEFATNLSHFFRDPCKIGACSALFGLFIIIPTSLFFMVVHCLFLPFPLGIIFLLKLLKTTPVTEESDTPRLIAVQIVLSLRKLRYRLTKHIGGVAQSLLKKFLGEESISGFFTRWVIFLPTLFFLLLATTISLIPFFMLLYLVSFIFTAVFGIITSSSIAPGATRVPAFYSLKTESDKYSRMVVFAFFGVIFGGVHCFAWNFRFPTPFEQHLWRATSLAITCIPVVVAPIDYVLENFKMDTGSAKSSVRVTLDLIMTILLFVYVPARLSLIAQALALLRDQPQSAFISVDWVMYIPHI